MNTDDINTKLAPQLTKGTIDKALLTGPGEDLVYKTIMQLSSIKGFQTIFGKVELDPKKLQTNNRIANYNRADWAMKQLPVMNIFTSGAEDKSSDNGWLTGSISFMVYWPAKFRRSDLTDVPLAFKGALENFFASKWVKDMMDRHVSIRTPATVFGLNEYGKGMTWTPNTEGFLENEKLPVTIVEVRYRIDLRAWYRELEQEKRTQDDPFEATLGPLLGFEGNILGVTDTEGDDVAVIVPMTVPEIESNP